MIRYGFAFIVLVHGVIHLMGYSKAFGYGNIQQFTKEISKPIGIAWLLASLLFLTTEILFLVKKDNWWMAALPAVLLSQVLIILYWGDARFGTVANLIIVIAGIVGFAEWDFNKMIKRELSVFWNVPVHQQRIVTNRMIADLPPIVQKWMQHSGIVGKPIIQAVRLKQKGMMLSKQRGKWMDFTAAQYFTTDKPAFNWQVKAKLMPLVYLNGRDKYADGKGEMLIKILSLKTIVDSKENAETDQGTLLRYLSEICWFPSAALNEYIKWEAIDNISARATMRYKNITASGIFFFTEHGDVRGFEAMRFGDFNGKTSLEKWHIRSMEFKVFDGIRIPCRSEVTWKLKDADFTWLKLELLQVDYNKHELF